MILEHEFSVPRRRGAPIRVRASSQRSSIAAAQASVSSVKMSSKARGLWHSARTDRWDADRCCFSGLPTAKSRNVFSDGIPN